MFLYHSFNDTEGTRSVLGNELFDLLIFQLNLATLSIKKVTSLLFILRLFRMSLSMVSLILSAKFFGVSIEKDMWVLVTTFLFTLGSAIWGPVNETFRAKFVFISTREGKEAAVSKTVSLVGVIIIATLALSLGILLLKDHLAIWLSPSDVSEDSLRLFGLLVIIMVPTLLINQITSIGISILNAYNIYFIPEVVGTVASLMNIVILFLLASRIGIFSLAISQYFAILLLLAAVVYYLKKNNIFQNSRLQIRFADFKIFLLFALPFFFPYFVGQGNALAEKWLAGSLGKGYISSLDYARQFTLVLQSVLSSVLTTVMVPMLAKAYAQNNKEQYQLILKDNITVCFGILALAVPLLCGAASPLCEFFFFRGRVSVDDLNLIILLTRAYSLAFMGVMLYIITGYSLLASENGKKYAFWGVIVQIMVLILNLSLIHTVGVYIFPFSLGIIHLLGGIIMAASLYIDNKKDFAFRISKYTIVVWVITGLIYLFNERIILPTPFLQLIINIPVLLFLAALFSPMLDIHLITYIKKIKHKLCRNS